jgi:hypothetical protein
MKTEDRGDTVLDSVLNTQTPVLSSLLLEVYSLFDGL